MSAKKTNLDKVTPSALAIATAKAKYPLGVVSAVMSARRLTKTTKSRVPFLAVAVPCLVAIGPLTLLTEKSVPERSRPLRRPSGGELDVAYVSSWTRDPQVHLIGGTYQVVVGPSYVAATPAQQRTLYQIAIDNDRSHAVLNVAHLATALVLRQATMKLLVGDRTKLSPTRAAVTSASDLGRAVALEAVKRSAARKLRERVNGASPARSL